VVTFLRADRFSEPAAQAFLKTLEEPEADTIFILCTESPQALLPTILSRCQKVRFAPLSRKDVGEALVLRLGLSPEKARPLVALANGSLGRALALASEDQEGVQEERTLAQRLFEATARENSPSKASWNHLAKYRDRNKAERVIDFLEWWYRDLLLFQAQGEDAVVNLDRLPALRAGGSRWSEGRLREAIETCEEIKAGIRLNANLHLALTVLVQRLSRIHRGLPATPPSLSAWPFVWRR
jgi:DNA polymerase-3 subunit delta'